MSMVHLFAYWSDYVSMVQLFAYWSDYVSMVQLFAYWSDYVSMIHLFAYWSDYVSMVQLFAYWSDCVHGTAVCLAGMNQLSETHPANNEEFTSGNHAISRLTQSFAQVWTDMALGDIQKLLSILVKLILKMLLKIYDGFCVMMDFFMSSLF